MLRDVHLNDKAKELYKKSPATANKIKKILSDLYQKLKDIYAKLKPQSYEARQVLEMKGALGKVQDLFVDGINAASQNLRNMEKAVDKGGAKAQDRFTYDSLVKKKDMEITSVDDSVSFVANRETRKNIITEAIKNAKEVGYEGENGNAYVHVDDINKDIMVSRQSIEHGLDRRLEISAPAVLRVGDILKNSIIINELQPKKVSASASYVLIGYAESADNKYVVKFTVNTYTDTVDSLDVLYAINTKKEPAGNTPGGHNFAPPTGSKISIRNLLDYVNRYFSDILPMDVLSHYGITERPAGEMGQRAKYQSRSDADYLSAVERGDMDIAQRMVDEAAKAAGYTVETYHGTDKKFNVFNEYGIRDLKGEAAEIGFHVGSKRTAELIYTETNELNHQVKRLYTNLGKTIRTPDVFGRWFSLYDYICYVVGDYKAIINRDTLDSRVKYNSYDLKADYDYNYADREIFKKNDAYYEMLDSVDVLNEDINFGGIKHISRGLLMDAINAQRNYLKSLGIGSIEYLNQYEDIGSISYLLLDAEQVKSADPVTYDDNGEVIPLSERFNTEKKDIRYQGRGDVFDIDDMFDDDDSIESTFEKEYATHREDMGEVLKNIADIDIAPKKVTSIINRVIRENLGSMDAKPRELLSSESRST